MSRPTSAELDALLAPQERFEQIRERALLRNGRRLCDLAYANPYAGPPPAVVDALRAALERTNAGALDLQYTPYGGATVPRRCVAERLSLTHGGAFHWRDVVLTPGAMAALNVVLASLAPGTIVVVAPCWLDTPLYVAARGHRCVLVPVRADDHRLDVPALAAALRANDDVRAVVLSQPANPTGVVYDEDELRALADALASTPARPLLVSDECHRALAFAPSSFCSPARLYDDTVVVYSFGKALALQGQRIGYAAVSPRMRDGRAFARTLERNCRTLGVCTPTALMQRALPALLDVMPDVPHVAERSALVYEALTKAGYACVRPDGTFFVYARVPTFGADRDGEDFAFTEALAQDGVLVMPSSLFSQPGWFRVSVTATDAMLATAVPILQAHAAGGGR